MQKKYEVIDETFKAIAESNTGAEDTLANYEWQNWKRKEIEERRAKWRSSSRDWRIESKSLREKLGIYFADPSIQSTFEEIVLKRRHAGNIITNLLTNNIESKSKADAAVHEATGLLTETVALLNKLGNAMAHEVKGDSGIAPKANRLQIPNFNDLDQVMPESP